MADREERWEREKRVLALASRGVPVGQIASTIGVSRETVSADLKIIYRRVTDMLFVDGLVIGEMVSGIRVVVERQTKIAEKAVKVRDVKVEGKDEPQRVTEPDYYARTNADGKILEAWRLMALILGFGKAEQSPVVAFVQQNINAPGAGRVPDAPPIDEKDVPKIRKHLRELRTLLHKDDVTTVTDAQKQIALRGVKDVPAEGDLHGVLLDVPPRGETEAIDAEVVEVADETDGHSGDDARGDAARSDDDPGAAEPADDDRGVAETEADDLGVSYRELVGRGW
jgi:DNA-binding transcriptional ArsR family regulator